MPRANRYLLPGYVYHLTHRCHNRSFLLRFARDRTEYRRRLREGVRQFGVSLLGYAITSNHTHLLAKADSPEQISRLMQKVEGEFAEYYNIRKRRSGAFWSGRYGCTMIDSAVYLWNCMKYIDLNMVRAAKVAHPSEWEWCGYRELTGQRQRYRLLDMAAVLEQSGGCGLEAFRENYSQAIGGAIGRGELSRRPEWTQSIAVGSASFIAGIEEQTRNRVKLTVEETSPSQWTLREPAVTYD